MEFSLTKHGKGNNARYTKTEENEVIKISKYMYYKLSKVLDVEKRKLWR